MTTLEQALQASAYVTAVADGVSVNAYEVLVAPTGHDGISYGLDIVDASGNRLVERVDLTLAEIQHDYPMLNWWPMRDGGDWGDEAEAQRHPNDGEPL